MNYKVNKIGLINFWLYDEETFDFEDGKLLLRGTNGSGKSVTMQSFIPLILDGNKNPSRLDPFGSKDKRIEDYLLGSADSEQKDEATGYLFMEMYNSEIKKYLTLGIGLHAKKGRPTDFWGFVIKDGKRIGKDILLYHSLAEKIPCTKKELRAKIGTENIFAETQKEYKEAVNKIVFGFPNLDMYDEFINLLLQLRSPKLSKEYKPTKLMEILSSVLQPLTEEDLRPLSEAIEEMDKTKEKTSQLESDVKNLSNLLITYNNYNETILYKKAESYITSLNEKERSEKDRTILKDEITNIKEDLEKDKTRLNDLEIKKETLEIEKANLDSRDLDAKIARFKSLENEIQTEQESKNKNQNDLNKQLNKIKDLEIDIDRLEKTKQKRELDSDSAYKDIEEISNEVKFQEIPIVLKDYAKDQSTLKEFSNLKIRLNNYKNRIETIKKELEKKKGLEEKQNEVDSELTKINKNYQNIKENLDKTEEEINDEILNIKDKIAYIGKSNEIIKLNLDEIKEITKPFTPYEKPSYQKSKQIYLSLAQKIKDSITSEIYNLKNKINLQTQKINDIKEELNKLKESKDLEIEKGEEEKETLNYLNEHTIPYIEFYKAIEFKDNVNEQTKNKLESTLLSSGILNSLIVNDFSKIENIKGNFITKGPKVSNNLTNFFKPAEEIQNKNLVLEVLESISTNKDSEISITKDYFKINNMRFQGSNNFKSIYIGLLARKKAKEEKIKQIQAHLDSEEAILNNLENLKSNKENELEKAQNETQNYPSNETLEKLENKLSELYIREDMINKQKNEKETQLEAITSKLEIIYKKLTELKQDLNFPLYLETFEEVLDNILVLTNQISEFEIILNNYYQICEQIHSKNEQISDIKSMVDDLNTRLNEINNSITKKQIERKNLNKILSSNEYKDLSEKLLNIDKQLKQIDEERLNLKEKQGNDRNALKFKEEDIITKEANYKQKEEIVKLKEEFFKEEYNLHYVEKEEIDNIKQTAKKIITKLSTRKDNEKNATNNYYDAYNNYRMSLSDYHLTSQIIFDKEIKPNDILDQTALNDLYQENRRNDFSVMYQGRTLNLYSLSKALTNAIEENKQIISEQDRHLFEEILLKTVGTKIRERIESSKNWVKEINQIMRHMGENSPLVFGLEWKSKSAEAIDEIETKELVRIFQIDPSMVTKTDSDKLINHFRSKLRRETELNGDSETYSSVIFDVLDYRNWFEFKMNYQRAGENKKELTNKVFSVFSGGEKAKTMYIPLFAAVYAKLMSAKKTAPRIIALDEAFAGVDDANIREMFGILSSLNLDYILTSQALWGDYDTVNDLAIAELIRPNNASAVCVRRYRWNGKVKEIVNKKDIEDATPIF